MRSGEKVNSSMLRPVGVMPTARCASSRGFRTGRPITRVSRRSTASRVRVTGFVPGVSPRPLGGPKALRRLSAEIATVAHGRPSDRRNIAAPTDVSSQACASHGRRSHSVRRSSTCAGAVEMKQSAMLMSSCRSPFSPTSRGKVLSRAFSSKSGARRHGTSSAPAASTRAAKAPPVCTRTSCPRCTRASATARRGGDVPGEGHRAEEDGPHPPMVPQSAAPRQGAVCAQSCRSIIATSAGSAPRARSRERTAAAARTYGSRLACSSDRVFAASRNDTASKVS